MKLHGMKTLTVNQVLKHAGRGTGTQILNWTLILTCLFCGTELVAQEAPAVVSKKQTIEAFAFNYFQGTAQYLDTFGLVEGASSDPSLTGIASVHLQGGSVLTSFAVCGQDFASDQEFAGDLKRKSMSTAVNTFSSPEVLAHVDSGISFFKQATVCPKASIPAAMAGIDNANWTYYVELTIGSTTEVIAAQLTYNCPSGVASC
jgi:hypothetical protein